MPKKKSKKLAVKPSAPLRWEFDPDIPTQKFMDGQPLTDTWDLQEAVAIFVRRLEEHDFHTWEAVVSQEQGLALTAEQEQLLDGLLNFGDPDDDQILYLNDIPRYTEPWHVILNKIVPYLLIEPFRTFDWCEEVKCDGWNHMMSALKKHGKGLSLPQEVKSPEEVVPAELRHKLWLQFCFNDLGGLGQVEELTLENEEQEWRIDRFVDHLRDCKESVEYLGLTLESLMAKVVLPERDQPIFVRLMTKKLNLASGADRLADHL